VSASRGAGEPLAVSPWPNLRLVLAMSHARLREAISAALTLSNSVSVVGRAGDLAGAIQVTREARPDGLVVGTGLLQGDCVRDLRGLVKAIPGVRIFVIGSETSAAFGAAMKAAGAADYVAFDSGTDSVVSAVRRAMPNDSADEA
jgi:DNA-binding NarL/FixJ family response regulator